MADEITITAGLAVTNGTVQVAQSVSAQADQTTQGAVVRKQSVPTSDTVITLTGVTTPRAIQIRNTDPTNYIKLGPTVAGAIAPLIRLQPGEANVISMEPGAVLRGQANGGAVIIEYLIVET